MNELSNEDINNFQEWSEGNKYLFELLCNCKKRGITTFASCGGHEVPYDDFYVLDQDVSFPYLGIVIDEKSLPIIKKIISELKDMKNITIESDWLNCKDSFGRFVIRAHHSNCCEMFYKANCAVIDSAEHSISPSSKMNMFEQFLRNAKARHLYKTVKKILGSTREDIEKKEISYELNTRTREFNKFIRIEGRGNFGLDELYKKYGYLQKEYSPTTDTKPIALLESADDKKLQSWDLKNWSQEELGAQNMSVEANSEKPINEAAKQLEEDGEKEK